jgi:hypothetical protein
MSKYYCLVAGLPDITFDDSKLGYSVASFKEELDGVLTSADKKLIDLFFLKFDNKNLIAFIKGSKAEPDLMGSITNEEFDAFYKALKNEEKLPKNKHVPSYMVEFLKSYVDSENREDAEEVLWEDRLAGYYYHYAMKCRNKFVSGWFELNLNINNLLTVMTCRKYGLDKNQYIVGNNDVAELLRSSNARDFGLGDEYEYLATAQHLADESDLMVRERKIDALKWQWLDEKTFYVPFDITSIFAYILKLEMIERWLTLDKTAGEKSFREIVGVMKTGSRNALDEFKRNNDK